MSYAAVAATKQDAVSLSEFIIQGKVPFIPVKIGVRRTINKSVLPITTYNSVKIMTEDDEEDHELRIIADSIIIKPLEEFCRKARSTGNG